MSTSDPNARTTLTLGDFTGVVLHDVSSREIERCAAALLDRGGRTTLLLTRIRDSIASEHAPRLSTAEIEQLGLESLSYTWSGNKRGITCSLSLCSNLFTLRVERVREGAMSLHLGCRAGQSEPFGLITRAMKVLGFERFDIGAAITPDETGHYTLCNEPRAHELSLDGREVTCGC